MLFVLFIMFGVANGYSQKFEPKWAGTVSAIKIDGDSIAVPTEKANVKIKTANSAGRLLVGIGTRVRRLLSRAVVPQRSSHLTLLWFLS